MIAAPTHHSLTGPRWSNQALNDQYRRYKEADNEIERIQKEIRDYNTMKRNIINIEDLLKEKIDLEYDNDELRREIYLLRKQSMDFHDNYNEDSNNY